MDVYEEVSLQKVQALQEQVHFPLQVLVSLLILVALPHVLCAGKILWIHRTV